MSNKKEHLTILHDYFVDELGLEYRRLWTGSHIHRYYAPGSQRNVTVLAGHGRKKDNNVNPGELGKQLARTLDGDVTRYQHYKNRINELLSD